MTTIRPKRSFFRAALAGVFIGLPLAPMAGCSPVAFHGSPVASQVPVPAPYPLTTQTKMQAMHHWDVLAGEMSERVAHEVKFRGWLDQWGIYVVPSGTTPFEKAFRELLVTHLVRQGLRVDAATPGQLLLTTEIQAVRHAERLHREPGGLFRVLSPGLVTTAVVPITGANRDEIARQVGAAEVTAEAGLFTPELPQSELLITMSLTLGGDFLARHSAIVYIDDAEWWQYRHEAREERRDQAVVTYRVVTK